MRKLYHVEAHWDPEAKVWVSKSDVPGLVIETATLAEFEALMRELVPEMVADNGGRGGVAVEWNAVGVFEFEAA
jgi:hypothetical protein